MILVFPMKIEPKTLEELQRLPNYLQWVGKFVLLLSYHHTRLIDNSPGKFIKIRDYHLLNAILLLIWRFVKRETLKGCIRRQEKESSRTLQESPILIKNHKLQSLKLRLELRLLNNVLSMFSWPWKSLESLQRIRRNSTPSNYLAWVIYTSQFHNFY
jgi:hypothetical protein